MGLVAVVIVTAIFALMGLIIAVPLTFVIDVVDLPSWFIFYFIVITVDSVFEAIVCYGLWSFQKWGVKLAVPVYGVGIVLTILSLLIGGFNGGDLTTGGVIIGVGSIGIYIWMLVYVSQSHIKELYRN